MDLGGTKKASSKAAELFGREQRSHHACLGSDSLRDHSAIRLVSETIQRSDSLVIPFSKTLVLCRPPLSSNNLLSARF